MFANRQKVSADTQGKTLSLRFARFRGVSLLVRTWNKCGFVVCAGKLCQRSQKQIIIKNLMNDLYIYMCIVQSWNCICFSEAYQFSFKLYDKPFIYLYVLLCCCCFCCNFNFMTLPFCLRTVSPESVWQRQSSLLITMVNSDYQIIILFLLLLRRRLWQN